MARRAGSADLPLHGGQVPHWLADRMTRLKLLRLNTMPAMDHTLLEDAAALQHLTSKQLRELGRLPYPMIRQKGDRGFRRVSWDEALDVAAGYIRHSSVSDSDTVEGSGPRIAFYLRVK